MFGFISGLGWILASLFKSFLRLEAENLALRHQLLVLHRSARRRARFRGWDRFLFVWLYRLWPGVLSSIVIVQPGTVLRWHRAGFGAFWRWRSRGVPAGRDFPEKSAA
jgi:hypothetical protein